MFNLLAAACLAMAQSSTPQPLPELVRNPGFETVGANGIPTDWSGWNDVWQPDTTEASTGARSARFTNSDASRYVLLSQHVAVQPGRRYRYSCKVKTRGISGTDSGATICMEWNDQKGAYLGGSYAMGIKNTHPWTEVGDITPRIPEGVRSATVSVYVRKEMTGTAWFDDVSVKPVMDPVFDGSIVVPGYRGVLAGKRIAPVRVTGWVGANASLPPSVRIVAEIVSKGSSRSIVSRSLTVRPGQKVDVQLATDRLPVGTFTVRARIEAPGSKVPRWSSSMPLVRMLKPTAEHVTFLADGTALIDNKPFFPIGLYEGTDPGSLAAEQRLKHMADGGFNCVMNYNVNSGGPNASTAYLDAAQKAGIRVIYSVKDLFVTPQTPTVAVGPWNTEESAISGLVKRFRSHPALFGWYLNDEMPLSMHARLRDHYQWVRKLDPNHPAWVVLYQFAELPGYVDTTDVMGADPYPIPSSPITMVSDWTDAVVATGQPAWIVPQVFDWSMYNPKERPAPPTLQEMRCMTWQALAHGANGLVFYSYFDLTREHEFDRRWSDVTKLVAEVKTAVPWLVADPRRPVSRAGGVQWRFWNSGRRWLVAVINTERASAHAEIKMPVSDSRWQALDGSAAPEIRSGKIEADLDPLEVRLYRLDSHARKVNAPK